MTPRPRNRIASCTLAVAAAGGGVPVASTSSCPAAVCTPVASAFHSFVPATREGRGQWEAEPGWVYRAAQVVHARQS